MSEQIKRHELSETELLGLFQERRQEEREATGENVIFGPGYGACVADYCQQSRSKPNNHLLEVLSTHLHLDSDKMVPVMAGSCDDDGYLSQATKNFKIVPLSNDLDLVVFESSESATEFKKISPIVLPHRSTQEVIKAIENTSELPLHKRGKDFVVEGLRQRDLVKKMISEKYGLPPDITIHLGGDEAIKAIFRAVADEIDEPKVLIPFPNYFDALLFAEQNGFKIYPAESLDIENFAAIVIKSTPDIIYLSNPNNPTGKLLNFEDLVAFLEVVPEKTRIIIDEVNINLKNNNNFMASDWQGLSHRFPRHHIIFVDSLSKSHDLVTERVGIALASQEKDQHLLSGQQPPRLAFGTEKKINGVLSNPVEAATIATMHNFYKKLNIIIRMANGTLQLSDDSGNFCTIFFQGPNSHELMQKFFKEIQAINPATIQAVRISGLPQSGAGELLAEDLEIDGSLKQVTIAKSGIVGLPENAVRLNSLTHPIILEALERSLK